MIARIDQDDTLPIDQVVHGECLSVMRTFPDNSVDSIVCDPPAGISFMNKDFDHHRGGRDQWIAWLAEIMREALRCLKPGGHAFVWSLPRTSHWTATALEDAGFEIRDCITHLFGSGFPKSQNISAMIDKMAGVEREVIGAYQHPEGGKRTAKPGNGLPSDGHAKLAEWHTPLTSPSTDDAKRFAGTGSALKPAAEFWWLCRKPLSEKTLAANCLKWGTGGLNIDKSRVGTSGYTQEQWDAKGMARTTGNTYGEHVGSSTPVPSKRFPSNVLFSHSLFCTDDVCDEGCPVRVLEQQSGVRKSGGKAGKQNVWGENHGMVTTFSTVGYTGGTSISDTGTAARFYHCFTPDVPFLYCAKSSRSERNLGCEELPEHERHTQGRDEVKWIDRLDGKGKVPVNARIQPAANIHPTVKSVSLMKYLVSLITPDNGIVLDMFFGSGSTGVAALQSGLHFIGIEQELEYVTIARARIAHALRGVT